MTSLLTAIGSMGVFLANLFLIFFIYNKQVRHLYKPIITVKLMEQGKNVDAVPSVLETGDLYVIISNISKNPAYKLRMRYEFFLEDRKVVELNKSLDYLNPGEAIRKPVELGKILQDYPDLFQEISKLNITKKIPKKTLNILLNITVTYNSPKYTIQDSYEIHWESLESLPDFENHPSILCWNKRNNIYIYKHKEFN